jgi:uncharacterized HAD superfamily protein
MSEKDKALRYNSGKQRPDLLHPKAIEGLVGVMTEGAQTYAPRNWESGFSWTSVIASLKRHLQAFEDCVDYDLKSGKLHIDHLAANVHFLSAFYSTYPEGDDRVGHWFRKPLKKVFCDLDGVLVDFEQHFLSYLGLPTHHPTDWDDYRFRENYHKVMEDKEFWLSAPKLIEPEQITYPISGYVTSRSIDLEITKEWLRQNGFPLKTLVDVGSGNSKVETLKELGCDVFVDDYIVNFMDCQREGILCYLMTRPHNEKYNVGHFRVENFDEFIKRLL